MTAAELVNQGYRKYIGWGDAEANADFNAVHPAKDPGYGGSPAAISAPSTGDVVKNAQALNDYYKTANAPIISTLQGQSSKLDQTYQDLVSNIKGIGQDQVNSATLNTNNELGRRGILSSSGLYQKDLTSAISPYQNATKSNLIAAEQGYNSDSGNLAMEIANAQAGNPANSLATSSNLASLAAQIAQSQYQSPLQSAQAAYYNAAAAGKIGASKDPLGLLG